MPSKFSGPRHVADARQSEIEPNMWYDVCTILYGGELVSMSLKANEH
jgi:hypothetical protein